MVWFNPEPGFEIFGDALWPVTIKVTQDGAPLVGAKVYFFTSTGDQQCPNTGLLQAWIRATDVEGFGSTQLYAGTYDVGILHSNLDVAACVYDWYGVGHLIVVGEMDFTVEVGSSVPSDPLPEEPPEEQPPEEPYVPPEEPLPPPVEEPPPLEDPYLPPDDVYLPPGEAPDLVPVVPASVGGKIVVGAVVLGLLYYLSKK